MGIGLSICQTIIEAHNGEIHADTHDEGSIFYFSLPKELILISFTINFFQKNLEIMKDYTILLIEDEKNIADFIEKILRSNDYKVVTASRDAFTYKIKMS